MRTLLTWTLLTTATLAAASLETQGWRRQEQSGVTAYFQGDQAMILVAPPKAFQGPLRTAYDQALTGFLGGRIVAGGQVKELAPDTYFAEYEVQEKNGTRTYRASLAYPRDGQFQALLYAANDPASFAKYKDTAIAFFDEYRGAAAPTPAAKVDGAIVGEWYTGHISSVQYRNQTTGMLAPPTGNNMTYKFLPDGTYQQYGLMQFNYGACTNSYFMNISGRYERNGSTLTMKATEGTFDSRTCGGNPVRKPANLTTSVYRIDVSGNEMKMTDEKGASSTYRRK